MYKIEKQFKNINQLIKMLKWFLIILLLIVTCTELLTYSFCWSISCIGNFFVHLARIVTKAIPLLAALLATFVADRHIVFASKNRDYDQAFEVTQITHRYIAISKDLRGKINFLRKMFAQGEHDIHAFTTIIQSIEKRYESLFEKEAYKYLDDKTVDKINSMSAFIFTYVSYVSTLKESYSKSDQKVPPASTIPDAFDEILKTIDLILEDLVELENKTLKEL